MAQPSSDKDDASWSDLENDLGLGRETEIQSIKSSSESQSQGTLHATAAAQGESTEEPSDTPQRIGAQALQPPRAGGPAGGTATEQEANRFLDEDGYSTGESAQNGNAWSWGTAWSAFAGAVQQDVTEITQSMNKVLDNVKTDVRSPMESPERTSSRMRDEAAQFKAIDDQVEQMASEARAALGSLWSGLGGALSAASTAAGQLESAALQAAQRLAERVVGDDDDFSPGMGAMGGERGTLMMRNDSRAGPGREDEWQMVDLLGSPAASVSVSFEQLFKLYRGPRFNDELEALGNESAKACNRIRACLPPDMSRELCTMLSTLASSLDLIADTPPDTDVSTLATRLCSSSTPSSCIPPSSSSNPRTALVSLCVASVDRASAMEASVKFTTHAETWEGLCRLRAEGLKLLAEFAALCIQHMAYLAMCLDQGDVLAAGLECDEGPESRGAAVRAILLQMLCDAAAIHSAYATALSRITSSDAFTELVSLPRSRSSPAPPPPMPAGDSSAYLSMARHPSGGVPPQDLVGVAQELEAGLGVGGKEALERILQATRQMLYPVCAPFARDLAAQVKSQAGTPIATSPLGASKPVTAPFPMLSSTKPEPSQASEGTEASTLPAQAVPDASESALDASEHALDDSAADVTSKPAEVVDSTDHSDVATVDAAEAVIGTVPEVPGTEGLGKAPVEEPAVDGDEQGEQEGVETCNTGVAGESPSDVEVVNKEDTTTEKVL